MEPGEDIWSSAIKSCSNQDVFAQINDRVNEEMAAS
jgi:hypothetical protein